jgi:hypothetical protein
MQWGPGPIPKLTPFTYRNRLWEVKVSNLPFMDWDLFVLQSAKARKELLPFSGRLFSKFEFKILLRASPYFIHYVLQAENNVL